MKPRALDLVLFIVISSVLYVLSSCKTTKITSVTAPKEISAREIERSESKRKKQVHAIWLKKIKGTYWDGNKEINFRANIKIKRDTIIITSVQNPIGIEVLRVICTPDSFGIIDRMNRKYYYGNYEKIHQKIGYHANFVFFQSILFNEIATLIEETKKVFFGSKETHKVVDDRCFIKMKEYIYGKEKVCSEISYLFEFNAGTLNILKSQVIDKNTGGKFEVMYTENENSDSINFPRRIDFVIEKEGTKISGRLKIEKIDFEKGFNTQFSISPKYEKIVW